MKPPVTAIYEANVRYPAYLRDLFIRLTHTVLVRAIWMETIPDEWPRNVLKDQ